MIAKIACLFIVFVALSKAQQDSNTNPCADDIFEICGMPFPEEYLAVYDARLCLKENSVLVSKKCQEYVNTVTPSIIEPCFTEIKALCRNVQPGSNRIHTCLSKYEETLSSECSVALNKAEVVSEEVVMAQQTEKIDLLNQSILKKMLTITKLQQNLSIMTVASLPNFLYSMMEDLYLQIDNLEESLQDILQSMSTSQNLFENEDCEGDCDDDVENVLDDDYYGVEGVDELNDYLSSDLSGDDDSEKSAEVSR